MPQTLNHVLALESRESFTDCYWNGQFSGHLNGPVSATVTKAISKTLQIIAWFTEQCNLLLFARHQVIHDYKIARAQPKHENLR